MVVDDDLDNASAIIASLYQAWVDALRTHTFTWLDEHLAEDFEFTARPYPGLRLDKAGFIEADKKMQTADIRFIAVRAQRVGDTVLSLAVADVAETFAGDLGAHMPSLESMHGLLGKNRLAYASAWRNVADTWVCFHHHMIGPVGAQHETSKNPR
ncbi:MULTISPECIES: nuclear transport factor 2 family protein [Pandoraea]|uniref:nuclear transport factor 2 family protein n=1 Tax=Pandoraea TaxID=93217 RepID=UPI001F5C7FEC|nr:MULTISPECIES: nuclear transport factor 2 family protein [Pandoraea]MCI3203524.1 hypothetical protein [Pandoraea sp. LA3]